MANNNKKTRGPFLPDYRSMIAAGINPKTKLPTRIEDTGYLAEGIKKILRVQDEIDAVTTFTWHNLPTGLTSDLMERVLYYRGQGAFFFIPSLQKFYFLPYALNGNIDCYGRFTGITPLPFYGSVNDGKEKDKPFIPDLVLKPIYDFPDVESIDEAIELFDKGCVIIKDYSEQISQTVLPRQMLNEPLLQVESELYPFARTALLNSTGVIGMRVDNEDEESNVWAASDSINRAALVGQKYIPVLGKLEFQELTGGDVAKSEEFLMMMQSLENFRLGTHGCQNGGIFQKKAHELQSENDMIAGAASATLQNRLNYRQHAADLINANWGLGVYVTCNEVALGGDKNLDGAVVNEEDQSGTSEGYQDGGTTDAVE